MVVCEDVRCPFHGRLRVQAVTVEGVVVSARMRRSVTVSSEFRVKLKKYERFAKGYTSLKAHNPDCIGAREGDLVTVAACRPLSKSKHYVVIAKKGSAMAAKEA
ncbi:30S ribosomal protein S17 [Candidatus Woesearchaeota archaeon]|nr:30S ribosomal protein S17 [Candidatus Woesearchaeota archaeon]